MKRLIAALQFLTVCPWVARVRCDERDIGRSTPWFPAVGLIVGIAVALLDRGVGMLFPPLLTSVISVVALIAASGGLHTDGLADTADGFLSSRPRERMLEIMRDSRTGAMGVVAIVAVFTLKVAALSAIEPPLRLATLVLMPFAGRCSMLAQFGVLNYARSGGLCSLFVDHLKRSDLISAMVLLAAVAWLIGGVFGLGVVGVAMAAVIVFARWSWSKIGGFTGDTLGAGCELSELTVALTAAACMTIK